MPLPATRVIVPAIDTLRTSLSPPSAMYRFPARSIATPPGKLSWALVAGPPSPQVGAFGQNTPVPADPGDRARRRDLAELAVTGVGDVHVAGSIDRNRRGRAQLGVGRRAAVAARRRLRALRAVAGKPGDLAARRHLADLVVPGVGDVHAAVGSDRDPVREAQLGIGGGAAVAASRRRPARRSTAGDRRDRAVRGRSAGPRCRPSRRRTCLPGRRRRSPRGSSAAPRWRPPRHRRPVASSTRCRCPRRRRSAHRTTRC